MTWRNRVSKFRDQFGLVQPDGRPSGNGVRYTCDFIAALRRKIRLNPSAFTVEDTLLIHELLDCLRKCERLPGLLCRRPGNFEEQQSFDDNIAYIAVSREYSERFLKFGRSEIAGIPFVYNNVDPEVLTLESWLGRNQALIAHAQVSVGESLPWYRSLSWAVSVALGGHRKDQDDKILTWHLLRAAWLSHERPMLFYPLLDFFTLNLRNQYTNGLGDVLKAYGFSAEHPTVILLEGAFI